MRAVCWVLVVGCSSVADRRSVSVRFEIIIIEFGYQIVDLIEAVALWNMECRHDYFQFTKPDLIV